MLSCHCCYKNVILIILISVRCILQINIKLKSEMPVQIDGEPWMQAAGNVIVRPILTQVLFKELSDIITNLESFLCMSTLKLLD